MCTLTQGEIGREARAPAAELFPAEAAAVAVREQELAAPAVQAAAARVGPVPQWAAIQADALRAAREFQERDRGSRRVRWVRRGRRRWTEIREWAN